MVLVLVVGDAHVPQRAHGVPEVFKKMFAPGRIHTTLITGNLGSREMYDYLRTISERTFCAAGDRDELWHQKLPETVTVEIEGLRFGLAHGHQVVPVGDKDSLAGLQRQLSVDVLVSGATHQHKVFEFDSRLFLNPGSLTGADSDIDCDIAPSFMVLDVTQKSVVIFTYEYVTPDQDDDGEEEATARNRTTGDANDGLRIRKKEWSKA